MIQYAGKEHRSALMKMWKLCFEDTDNFIRFYFNTIFREDETLVYTYDGEPVASLQMIPYQLKIGNKLFTADYVSGVMTHPGFRRKGLMNELLHSAFEEMKKKNIPFSFLIPQEKWLFGFYEKFGYQSAFPLSVENMEAFSKNEFQELKSISVFSSSGPWVKDLYPIYYQFLSRQENVVLKSEQQFGYFLEDLFIDGGKVFVDGNDQGIAFAVPYKTRVIVKEYFHQTKANSFALFSAIKKAFNISAVNYLNHTGHVGSRLYGMIRTIDQSFFPEKLSPDIYMSMMLD